MVIIKPNYSVAYKVQFELSQYIVIFHAVEIINYLLCSESSISYKKPYIQCTGNIPFRDKM